MPRTCKPPPTVRAFARARVIDATTRSPVPLAWPPSEPQRASVRFRRRRAHRRRGLGHRRRRAADGVAAPVLAGDDLIDDVLGKRFGAGQAFYGEKQSSKQKDYNAIKEEVKQIMAIREVRRGTAPVPSSVARPHPRPSPPPAARLTRRLTPPSGRRCVKTRRLSSAPAGCSEA